MLLKKFRLSLRRQIYFSPYQRYSELVGCIKLFLQLVRDGAFCCGFDVFIQHKKMLVYPRSIIIFSRKFNDKKLVALKAGNSFKVC